jgi:uncharacterized protein (TIGR02266 family)
LVRFALAGREVQCGVHELTAQSAFVTHPAPPPAGSKLALLLELPGEAAPLAISAAVRVVEPGGFWADFIPGSELTKARLADALVRAAQKGAQPLTPFPAPRLTPEHLARLALVARPVPAPPAPKPIEVPPGLSVPAGFEPEQKSGIERRRAPRIPIPEPVAVRFTTVEDFVLAYVADVSQGGIFVRTNTPPALGARVTVRLELPDGGPPAETVGTICHRLLPEHPRGGRDPGAGVQFEDDNPEFKARIEKFLDWALEKNRQR